MFKTLLLVTGVIIFLQACANNQPISATKPALPSLNTAMFTPEVVTQPDDIFYLTDAQQTAFQDYYFAASRAQTPGNIRLFEYLQNFVDDFNFHGVTLTATEALQQKTGNCLTLAIVTKALADTVGLETGFQRVNSAPVYARYANLMTLSSHVRTYVYAPNQAKQANTIVIRRASVIIDYFPTSPDVSGYMVSEADFIAMYYQNMAAEAMLEKRYDFAYSLLEQGLRLNHSNPETLNTLAVLFSKVSQQGQSEKLYAYMLDNHLATANVLTNYVAMLQSQGRLKEAKIFAGQIDKIEDDNPYRWIDLADKAYNNGDFVQAEKYYKKASRLAPYVHEGQFGLAKSYYQLGQLNSAKVALTKAIEADYRAEHKSLYQAKLHTLLNQD